MKKSKKALLITLMTITLMASLCQIVIAAESIKQGDVAVTVLPGENSDESSSSSSSESSSSSGSNSSSVSSNTGGNGSSSSKGSGGGGVSKNRSRPDGNDEPAESKAMKDKPAEITKPAKRNPNTGDNGPNPIYVIAVGVISLMCICAVVLLPKRKRKPKNKNCPYGTRTSGVKIVKKHIKAIVLFLSLALAFSELTVPYTAYAVERAGTADVTILAGDTEPVLLEPGDDLELTGLLGINDDKDLGYFNRNIRFDDLKVTDKAQDNVPASATGPVGIIAANKKDSEGFVKISIGQFKINGEDSLLGFTVTLTLIEDSVKLLGTQGTGIAETKTIFALSEPVTILKGNPAAAAMWEPTLNVPAGTCLTAGDAKTVMVWTATNA